MPPRSKVFTLPPEVRAELDRRLVGGGFGGYDDLAAWLEEEGYGISASSLHRYGSKFERNLTAIKVATDQARAVADTVGDDEGRLGEAVTALIQQKTFEFLVDLDDVGDLDFVKVGEMAARLNSTSVKQKKFILDVRARAAAVADEVAEAARSGGLSDDTVQAIKSRILGIAT